MRPPGPRFLQNMYRTPRPYHHQWRPNHAQPAPFSWGANFGPNDKNNESNVGHWCETCDRGFPTTELLSKHQQQHQKCNIDGCQFVAHPKVITKHIQMQHSSGLYKKIANLNNPEEIQKWREERKKKYPTKSNIEKKAAEVKEKIERGEKMALLNGYKNKKPNSTDQRMEMKRKHGFDKRKPNHRTNTKHNFKNGNVNSASDNKPPDKKKPKVLPVAPITVEKNKLMPFTGIFNIVMDDKVEDTAEIIDSSNGLFEDDAYEEIVEMPKETSSNQEPIVCGALTSLMCDYGTSDEEIETETTEKKPLVTENQISKEPTSTENIKKESPLIKSITKETEANDSDDDGPDEVKIVKTDITHDTAAEPVTKVREKPAQLNKINPPKIEPKQIYRKHKIPSTLLQKLLFKEIRQERNIVLQCIRYIKNHNYFDKPK